MRFPTLPTLLASIALCVSAGAATAHHSFAMFDAATELELEGTIRDFQWTNPHSWVQLTVMENGQTVEYSIEWSSPNILARRGWSRTSLKPGDRVKVKIHPLKDGAKGGAFVSATFADGRVLGAQGG